MAGRDMTLALGATSGRGLSTKARVGRDFAGEVPAHGALRLRPFIDHMLSSHAPLGEHSSAPRLSASWLALTLHF